MRKLGAKLAHMRRLWKDQSGNMAAVVAMAAVPLMMAGGAAVDYGNWVSVQAPAGRHRRRRAGGRARSQPH